VPWLPVGPGLRPRRLRPATVVAVRHRAVTAASRLLWSEDDDRNAVRAAAYDGALLTTRKPE